MSVGTRTEIGRPARRAHSAERVKSGAAQRAYERRRQRVTTPAASAGSELTGRAPFVAAILAMFGCGLALTLVLTTRAAEDSYQLSDAREANRVLSDERAALQREVAAADSAPVLAARARELGMIPADDPARLVVAPDGTITVIGEPAPAQGPPAPPLNAPPRTAPPSGADPGERVVPVPVTPPVPAANPDPGNVLAAPGVDPAQLQPQPVPAPGGAPVPGQPPAGAVPAPEDAGAPVAPAPGTEAVPPAVPAPDAPVAGAPAPVDGAAVPAPPAEPGAAAVPPPAPVGSDDTSAPAVPPPAGAPVAREGPAAGAGGPAVPPPAPAGMPAGAPGAVAGEEMR
ncbi:hypothetical protein [Nocardia carnea]|uniref:hypothetical protein n=1 Tax=Nocardia carnea TaxID=37328 RepID=UPI0024545FF7|nr:hypothetical protein [Nocardia carnea]